jgi:hypothetical protein
MEELARLDNGIFLIPRLSMQTSELTHRMILNIWDLEMLTYCALDSMRFLFSFWANKTLRTLPTVSNSLLVPRRMLVLGISVGCTASAVDTLAAFGGGPGGPGGLGSKGGLGLIMLRIVTPQDGNFSGSRDASETQTPAPRRRRDQDT